MHRRNLLLLVGFTCMFNIHAQKKNVTDSISKHQIRRVINREFANLISPHSKGIVGNYGSIDTEDSRVSFAGNIVFRSNSILGIKMSGSGTDKLLPVFKDSQLSSDVSVDLQYNVLTKSLSEKIFYDNASFKDYKRSMDSLQLGYEKAEQDIINYSGKRELQKEIRNFAAREKELKTWVKGRMRFEDSLRIEIGKLEIYAEFKKATIENLPSKEYLGGELNSWRDSVFAKLSEDDGEVVIRKRDSIEFVYNLKKYAIESGADSLRLRSELAEMEKKKAKMMQLLSNAQRTSDSLENDLKLKQIQLDLRHKKKQLVDYPSVAYLKNQNLIRRSEGALKLEKNLRVEGIQMGWFSFGFGFSHLRFKLFDPQELPEEQVTKESYPSFRFNFQYSLYRYSPLKKYRSYFLSFGISSAVINNLEELSPVEIKEQTEHGAIAGERTTSYSYKAYLGDYDEDILTTSIFFDSYFYLFNNLAAIHFYPEYKLACNSNPSINTGVGFLVAFRNMKDTGNLINTEVFLDLVNLSNSNESPESLLNRSGFGIRFTVPINILPKTDS